MSSGKRILLNGSHPDYLVNLRGDLIEALARAGHEIHVSSPNLAQGAIAALEARGAIVHQITLDRRGLGMLGDFRYFFELRSLIRQIAPELVLGYTIKPNIWGTLAAKSAGVPSAVMVTGLGYAFMQGNSGVDNVIGMILRRLYRLATDANFVVIFQNPEDRDDFLAAGSLADPAKARLINGSGVNLRHFQPTPLPEKPSFLMIARLLGNKGVREYANASIALMKRGVEARFKLAGFLDFGLDSISREELESWKSDGLEFLGKLEDIRPAMSEANVYVLPSYREGTPRTVLEAAAMGRPSITSDAPGCRQAVVDGETGILVPVRDVTAVADAMEKLADDPSLRASMGAAARSFCESKYSVDTVNCSIMEHLGLEQSSVRARIVNE